MTKTPFKKPTFDVMEYGAVGDGVTDDRTAFTTAITAAFAVNGLVTSPAGKTFMISPGAITVSTRVSFDFRGSTIKKTNSWTTGSIFSLLNITAAGVEMRNLVLDCNLAGGANGYGITWSGTDGVATNVEVKNCGYSGGNGICWTINGDRFKGTRLIATNFRNTGEGFQIGADDAEMIDCHATGAGQALGSYAAWYVSSAQRLRFSGSGNSADFGFIHPTGTSTGVHCLNFTSTGARTGCMFLNTCPNLVIDRIDGISPGQTDAFPSGNALQLINCDGAQIGHVRGESCTGYTMVMTQCDNCSIDTVFGLGGDDPALSLNGDNNFNAINAVHAHSTSTAVAFENDGGQGSSDYNTIGLVNASKTYFSAVNIWGTHNYVGTVVARDVFSYAGTAYSLGVVQFYDGAVNCVVERVDHVIQAAIPSGFDDRPESMIHFNASTSGNKVLGAIWRSQCDVFKTDLGTANTAVQL